MFPRLKSRGRIEAAIAEAQAQAYGAVSTAEEPWPN